MSRVRPKQHTSVESSKTYPGPGRVPLSRPTSWTMNCPGESSRPLRTLVIHEHHTHQRPQHVAFCVDALGPVAFPPSKLTCLRSGDVRSASRPFAVVNPRDHRPELVRQVSDELR